MTFAAIVFLFFTSFLSSGPDIHWLTPTEHDFGDIIKGTLVEYAFEYRNDGQEPLTIDNLRPSCGCTTPDWPREAILPDSTGTIKVVFSARMPGNFRKLIKVYFSGQRKAEKLYVSGYVE